MNYSTGLLYNLGFRSTRQATTMRLGPFAVAVFGHRSPQYPSNS